MKRKELKRVKILFSLLLLFSFTFGFFPGSIRAIDAEELNSDYVNSAIIEEFEEDAILDEQLLTGNVEVKEEESIKEILDNQEKKDFKNEENVIGEPVEHESNGVVLEAEEQEESVSEEKFKQPLDDAKEDEEINDAGDLEENSDEEYEFEKELEPNRPIGGPDPLIMLPTASYRSMSALSTKGLVDTISVNKTAVRSPGCRTFEVTLDITGTPQEAPVDVVLIIDRSGSMGFTATTNPTRTRLYYAKQAAVNFAGRVLGPNGVSGSRVSVVSFSGPTSTTGYGNENQASTDLNLSTNLTTVTNIINGISAVGGTNTEAGFEQGQAVIQGTTSNQNPNSNKVVIMLTDGLPTASNGNRYADTTDINHIHIQRAIAAGKNIYQNDIADVFTIGLTTGMNATEKALADNILTQAQNKGYYPAPSATDLDAIFDAISQSLGYAATNAKVVDKIGDNFNLVESSLPSGASYNSTTREISWNPGTIVNGAQLKYIVQAKSTFAGGLADTNKIATLTYKDIFGTSGKTKTFPIPNVNVPTLIKLSLTDAKIIAGNSISLGAGVNPLGENYMSPVSGGDNDGLTFTYEWRKVGDPTIISPQKNPSVSPTTTAEYEVTVTDSNGCKAKATMTVKVIQIKTVTATKNWVNGPQEHPAIWFKLYRMIAGGIPVAVPDVPLKKLNNGNTTANWTNLPTTDMDENLYLYSVVEGQLDGTTFTAGPPLNYEVSYTGLTVTNTYKIPMTGQVQATKSWVNGPQSHPTVWFKLYRKTTVGALEVVPNVALEKLDSGDITANWSNLATTDINGNPYTFSVKEGQLVGSTFTEGPPLNYEVAYSADGLTITNTYKIPMTGQVQATKNWINGPQSHPTVWFKLYRKTTVGALEVVPNVALKKLEDGDITANWSNLATTDINGNPYIFSVKEGQLVGSTFTEGPPLNYEVAYSADGLTVTNTYKIPMTGQVQATKNWINGPQSHPTVWFKLYRKTTVGALEVVPNVALEKLEGGDITANWSNLETTDINGNPYIFSVKEGQLVGSIFTEGPPLNYEVTYSADNLSVTNTYTLSEVTVSKVVEGNLGNKNKIFTFTATLSSGAVFSAGGGYAVNPANSSEATFTLKDGESVNLVVPVGANLSILESDNDGYVVTVKQDGISVSYPGLTITVPTEVINIQFINTKRAIIDTAVRMDSYPYIIILTLIGISGFGALLWNRKRINFN